MATEKILVQVEVEGDVNQSGAAFQDISQSADKATKSVEGTNKAVHESGGAMGILNMVTGGYAQVAKDAYEATTDLKVGLKLAKLQATLFGTAMRTALTATGIGAVVLAVSLLVEYWDDITDYVGLTNKALEEQVRLTERLGIIRTFQLEQAEEGLKRAKLENEERKRLGQQNEHGFANEVYWIKKVQEAKLASLEAEKEGLQSNLSLAEEGSKEALQFATDILILEDRIKTTKLQNGLELDAERRRLWAVEDEALAIRRETEIELAVTFKDEIVKIAEDEQTEILDIQKKGAKEWENREKGKSQFQKDLAVQDAQFALQTSSQLFGALAQMSSDNLAAYKAFSIAKVLVDTASASLNIWTTPTTIPDPYGSIFKVAQQVAVVASSISAINQIKQAQPSGTPVSSLTTTSPFSSGATDVTPPPQFAGGAASGNQLGDDIAGALNGGAIKAYVVSTDITTAQQMDRETQNTSTL